MANLRANKIVGIGSTDAGVVFQGDVKINSQGVMYFPTGTTTNRGRGRGVWAGGRNPSDSATTDYIAIQSGGTAQDFGDLTVGRNEIRGLGSSTRGVFGGGRYPNPSVINVIDYITLATTSNAADFGDLTDGRRNGVAGLSDSHGGLGGY